MTDQSINPFTIPDSPYFVLETLADGVYAAISSSRAASSNAAIIDLGGAVLIFDTFYTPAAAADLRLAAERLARSPVRYVVNSHWHADHVLGNAIYGPEVRLIATAPTRGLLNEYMPGDIRQMRQGKTAAEIELFDLQNKQRTLQDVTQRNAIEIAVRDQRAFLDSLSRLKVRLPDWTFEQQLVLHGEKRVAELITFGSGHTDSDAILYLPGEKIVFVGDLLFNGQHAWMGSGHPAAWLAVLDEIAAFNPSIVVPGHGPVGSLDDFADQRADIEAVQAAVADLLERYPVEPEEWDVTEGLSIPASVSHLDAEDRFRGSVLALYRRQAVRLPARNNNPLAPQG